jgi:GDP/UDP-N,N'-diacetylbacillosamine 2-epimerase (hydrolysing)
MKKNICFITTTRADYGLLKPLIKSVDESKNFNYTLVVSGTHLIESFGNTYLEIEKDFKIDEKIFIPIFENNVGICKSNGCLQIIFSQRLSLLNSVKPIDLVIILGDRFEMLNICQVCFILKLKICHISGGDVTEGAFDNVFRNCISQMSHYHLPTCEESKINLINMGICKDTITIMGNPGLEIFNNYNPLNNKDYYLNKFGGDYILIVFHPETLQKDSLYIKQFFDSIKKSKYKKVIIKPNCDPYYKKILSEINETDWFQIINLEREEYLSIAYHCKYYVGNSSSGLYELPHLKIQIINVGDRQKGRKISSNVLNTDYNNLDETISLVEQMDNKIEFNGGYEIYNSKEIFMNYLETNI